MNVSEENREFFNLTKPNAMKIMTDRLPILPLEFVEEKCNDWLGNILSHIKNQGDFKLSMDLLHLLRALLNVIKELPNEKGKNSIKCFLPKIYEAVSNYYQELKDAKQLKIDQDAQMLSFILQAYIICIRNAEIQITKPYECFIEDAILNSIDSYHESLLITASQCLIALNTTHITHKTNKDRNYFKMIIIEINTLLNDSLTSIYDDRLVTESSKICPIQYNRQVDPMQNFALFQTRLSNLFILLKSLLKCETDVILNIPIAALINFVMDTIELVQTFIPQKKENTCPIELLFDNYEAKLEIIVPCIFQNILSLLDDIIITCNSNLIPYLTYIIRRVHYVILEFINSNKPSEYQYSPCQRKTQDYSYTIKSQNMYSSLRNTLYTSWIVLVETMGSHIELDKKIMTELYKFMKSDLSGKFGHKCTTIKLNAMKRSNYECLRLIKAIFLFLNYSKSHNKTLIKNISFNLSNYHQNYDVRHQNLSIYLECLFSYITNYPYPSKNMLTEIIDCFKVHTTSPTLKISSFSRQSLAVLECLIHPKCFVTPCLSQKYNPNPDEEMDYGDLEIMENQDNSYRNCEKDMIDPLNESCHVKEAISFSSIRDAEETVYTNGMKTDTDISNTIQDERISQTTNEVETDYECPDVLLDSTNSKKPEESISMLFATKETFLKQKQFISSHPISEDLQITLGSFVAQSSSDSEEN